MGAIAAGIAAFRGTMFIGVGLIEAMPILAIVIGFLVMNK